MRHSIKSTMFVGAFLFSLLMCFTSCEDILGTWDKPTPVTPTPTPTPEPEPEPTPTPGLLAGKFKINADGDQVQFSPGNLQYNSSEATYKWRFAEHQYDYVGAWSTTTWVDLFGWGTWTGTATNPINESTTDSQYTWDAADFTQESKLADESQRSYDWRTLTGGTGGEWEYLFNTRTTTTGIRYAKATVNGKVGVILLPDDWNASYYALTSTNTPGAAYTTNEITADDWTNKLETHGAVFLPAAGRRYGTTVSYVGTGGYYWSSTVNSTNWAFIVNFGSGGLTPAEDLNRLYGYSVRLVRDAE